MAPHAHQEYPAVTGLIWHRDQYYSFFIPIDWHKMAWPDDREGVIYGPDATDPLTVFAVDIKDLGTLITADDLDVLAAGFFEGIEQLPESEIEHRDQRVTGKLLELEAKYRFREQGETRKRWVRVFYNGTRQIAMTAQGATTEKYDYWLPWFFEAMMTADIHNQKPQFAPGG
jgi:hypothetical protein